MGGDLERGGRHPGSGDQAPRLDALLVERGLARSRGEAQVFVTSGRVKVDGRVVDKPGRRLAPEARIEVDYPETRFVSRGGRKLEKALDTFDLDVRGLVCADIGASTGGFTDCLLSRGARRVYAVDVGYGLLAWSLRSDPRVVTLDRTNARYLTPDGFRLAVERELAKAGPGNTAGHEKEDEEEKKEGTYLPPTFATCDVSFISLFKVVPAVLGILEPPWDIIALVKPQFEAGREKVGSKGVVRDPAVHEEVLESVLWSLAGEGAAAAGLTYSPIRGPEGNIEYLLHLKGATEGGAAPSRAAIAAVVAEAFKSTVPD